MGNSFGFAGHIRDKLGIRGPVRVLDLKLKNKGWILLSTESYDIKFIFIIF